MPEQRPTLTFELRDGSAAEVRPLEPDDRLLVAEGLSQMSIESRFARFGTGVDHLTEAELDYLTKVDQVNHVAWGAVIEGEPAGVGRYLVIPGEGCAEIALTVVDAYQGRGLGRVLFDALVASARAAGIGTLCFSVQPSNATVRSIFNDVALGLELKEGMVEARIDLDDVAPTDHDRDLVRLLAAYQG